MAPPDAVEADVEAARSARWRLLLGGALLVVWALFVAAWLIPLALDRYVHVDEVQVAYNAALLGLHGLADWMNFRAPFVVALSWLTRGGGESWPMLLEMRAVFFLLFLFNLVLVAFGSPRLRGLPAHAALLLAATLVQPFWRHGFEIRHDALLLTSSLALYVLTQRAARRGLGDLGWGVAGALAAWAQLNSFKAFLIWPPALLLLVAVARRARPELRLLRAAAAGLAGAGASLLLAAALLAGAGLWSAYWSQLSDLGDSAAATRNFAAGGRIGALLLELPHLALLAAVSVARAIVALRRSPSRDELASIVCASWLLLELVALHLNPVPYTYNLVHLVPFLFLGAIDGLSHLRARWPRTGKPLVAAFAVASVVALVHSWRIDRVGRVSGAPQRSHVEAAEALTAGDEPVLDAAGLVLSRRPPGKDWMLHSLFVGGFRDGRREPFRVALARDPAPVLLTNYRWSWLDRDDDAFVRARYRPLGARILVLGGELAGAAGTIEIHRAGRYLFEASAPSAVDGTRLAGDGVAALAAGAHEVTGGPLRWRWLGPHLAVPPDPGPPIAGRDLFVSD